MSARVASLVASVTWSVAVGAAVASIAIRLVRNDPVAPNTFGMGPAAMMAFLVFGLAWATVGALLMSRRPHNATGRYVLLIGSAYVWSILFASIAFAGLADGSSAGRMIAGVAGWLTALATLLGWAAFNLSIFFPTGRGHTPAWDKLGRIMFVPLIVVGAYLLTKPGDLHLFPGLENPFGFAPDLRPLLGDRVLALTALGSALFVPVIAVGFVSRYRAAGLTERLQLRWFAAATLLSLLGLVVVGIAGALLPGRTGEWPLIAFALTGTTVPVSIGIAILRHHLYDIDRIISRTIAYGLVSALLFGLFLGINIVLQSILSSATEADPFVVALSTLVVAAVFQPLRRRIQAVVDRRFNRARYDAIRTTQAFAERLRDQLDLATLGRELERAAADSVEPESSAVWLRRRGIA